MNLQNLMSQLKTATNPQSMMMSMLSGNQRDAVNLFRNKPTQEQAEEIASKCNELGISKEQLQGIIGVFRR